MNLKKAILEILEEQMNRPQIGININDKHQDFTGQILRGEKVIETRSRNVFKKLVGRRVGLIRTGKGKAILVGYATIGKPIQYNSEENFRKDYEKHRVEPKSKYDIQLPKGKIGYPLAEVRLLKTPKSVKTVKIVGDGGGYSWRWFI
jgi:hypothetical protein